MLTLVTVLALQVVSPAGGAPGSAALPDDPRLASVRLRLEQTLATFLATGLPGELVVSKVREGLAKGVDASRIDAAVTRLVDNLAAAQRILATARPGPAPVALVRAVAEARNGGVSAATIQPLLARDGTEGSVRRAVEVLTELTVRGYPTERAGAVVRDVLTRDAGGLDRLPGALDTIRQDHALSHAEATDAIARGLATSKDLQSAYERTVDDERRRGGSPAHSKAKARGKSDTAPGHLPRTRAPNKMAPPKK